MTRGFFRLAAALGLRAVSVMQPSGLFDGVDALVPVPFHWRKKWKRGYNQTEMIARGDIPCDRYTGRFKVACASRPPHSYIPYFGAANSKYPRHFPLSRPLLLQSRHGRFAQGAPRNACQRHLHNGSDAAIGW